MAAEPFDTVEAAIESAVAGTLPEAVFLRYEPDAMPSLPACTLIPTDVQPEQRGHDQGFTVGLIRYELRIYTRFNKDPRLAWDDAKNQLRDVFDALGADRSLTRAVSSIDIESSSFSVVTAVADGHRELMTEIVLVVRPRFVASA